MDTTKPSTANPSYERDILEDPGGYFTLSLKGGWPGYLIVAVAALLVGSLIGFTVGHMSGTPYELRTRADQIEKDLKAELAEKLHGSSGVEK